MAIIPTYFSDYLSGIRLTSAQIEDCRTGHRTLRKRLREDPKLGPIVVDSFLQGSYRRATAIRPSENAGKLDVDVIVVTTLDRNAVTPSEALDIFRPFLNKHYENKYKLQGRSWKIELSSIELDLVPTSAPSEAVRGLVKSHSVTTEENIEEALGWRLDLDWPSRAKPSVRQAWDKSETAAAQWQREPLWIPDREAKTWDQTHPLAQIAATSEKNSACKGHFVSAVKCIKYWRVTREPSPKYPKSYPLEHLIWRNCPDGIDSVALGVVRSLECICDNYKDFVAAGKKPSIPDHGVPGHDVLSRVSPEDFVQFHRLITDAAKRARRAFDEEDTKKSARLWRDLFGDKFPAPPPEPGSDDESGTPRTGGFTPRKQVSAIGAGRFASG